MNKRFTTYSLIALIAGSTIAACTFSERVNAEQKQAPVAHPVAQSQQPMTQNREVDQMFIEMMVPHHQSANEMARIELQKGKNAEVKKLAQKIIDQQKREIQQMQTWYRQWYGTDLPMMKTSGNMSGMRMSNSMSEAMMISMRQQEQMNQEMINSLRNASNPDQEFLRQMTRHHRMATMMAGMVVDSATHPEIRNLAQSIVKSQDQEIAQMQQLMRQARAK